jgi:long-subunit acyl-CoA synthetase (AMP-forming)
VTSGVRSPVAPPPALGASSMCEAFQLTVSRRPDEVALRSLDGDIEITFAQYAERVRQLAAALHALGVRRGDTVGFMLTNRIEFHLLDCAAMHLGATPFSIYNTSSPEQIAYLLGDAANRVLIVEQALAERARSALRRGGMVEHLAVIDGDDSELTLAAIEALEPDPSFDFDAAWRAVRGDDVLTLIYTSGTTGPPKGVQLTHRNQLEQCRGLQGAMPWRDEGGAAVSFLPSAHIADRGMVHLGQMIWGFAITPCPDAARVFEYVAAVRPTWFGSVPRMWEKLKASLEASGAALADPAAVRAQLGFDRCELYLIGAAPAPLDLFEFFDALGIPICEVWGMSELSCVATLVPPEAPRYGTVGKPLPGVELRIADDGELLVRGGIVMAGYRNQPEKTAETIDADGWLQTGDIGTIDEDGTLRIVDRKKELIINAAGKNMSPANIEQQLKMGSPLIGQAVAIGDRRPYNVALIVLDPDACAAFADARGMPDGGVATMAREDPVLAEVAAGVERANDVLSRVEQIKRFTILPVDWPPAGDELTPTMKLKRRPIAEKYAAEIDALYH